ncbi:MAG: hypothetical protein H6839_03155 [Planctomycetes bacterium]|nr:hypothetical protein [Planctomycetota bacterium]
MQKTFVMLAALLIAGLAFVGCKSSGSGETDNGSGGACGESACGGSCNGGGGSTDMADMMIKMYTEGQQKASPFVVLHEFVSVGQYWEVTSSFGGQKSVNKWQVAAKAEGTKSEFIVENDMGQGYILAYQVDAWAEQGKPNVKRAWIGKPGEEPQEIEVMDWKDTNGGTTPEFNGIVLKEDFKGVELAGKKFDGELVIVKSDGNTTKTWTAENGWFSKVIKMEMNGDVVMELTGVSFDEKVEAWLKWKPDEKK